MQLKTLFSKNKNKGFTLFEVLITFSIFMVLIAIAIMMFHPIENQQRARDEKRISDLSLIDRAISEYVLDNNSYPDQIDTTRKSNILPQGGTQLTSPVSGWIYASFSSYTSKLPVDPINDETYHYSYRHSKRTYELNAKLETLGTYMSTDGGNDLVMYEIGNDLTLISPL